MAAVAATGSEKGLTVMGRIMAGRLLTYWAALVVISLMACQGPAGAQGDGVPWKSYDEALQEAEETGRPVYLYFFMDNCAYCYKMDKEVFTDKKVAEYLRENFVSSRVNAKRDAHLLKKYIIRGFPTSWFLTSEGDTISYLPGYIGPEYFFRMLKYFGEEHFKSQSLRDYLRGS